MLNKTRVHTVSAERKFWNDVRLGLLVATVALIGAIALWGSRDGHGAFELHRMWGVAFGWSVPPLVAWLALAWVIAVHWCLIVGPEPRYATRWAWFWLFWSGLGPLMMVLYLTFGLAETSTGSGTRRRLTGGWAFLLGFLLPRPFIG